MIITDITLSCDYKGKNDFPICEEYQTGFYSEDEVEKWGKNNGWLILENRKTGEQHYCPEHAKIIEAQNGKA